MSTAIIGVGRIGSRLTHLLFQGGERVVLASAAAVGAGDANNASNAIA
jgi:predicted dinucleotide-binding enzyme